MIRDSSESQLKRHLFENRSTGMLVAHMRGAETIREFVSGAAVTLILDFPFLLTFLTKNRVRSVTLMLSLGR